MLAEQTKMLVEQTKKAVEVIEQHGFQSVISINSNVGKIEVHLYEEAELNGFECEVLTAKERESEYGMISVVLDGIKVFALTQKTTLQIA